MGYCGMLQIVLDPLSRFENHTHQAILAREGLARQTKVKVIVAGKGGGREAQ